MPLDHFNGNAVEPAGTPYVDRVNCRYKPVDGYLCTYVVYVPNGVLRGPDVPLVVMQHGSSGNGGQFLRTSGWREKTDDENLIAVFPTATMVCTTGTRCEVGELSGWTTKWNTYATSASSELNFSVRPPAGF